MNVLREYGPKVQGIPPKRGLRRFLRGRARARLDGDVQYDGKSTTGVGEAFWFPVSERRERPQETVAQEHRTQTDTGGLLQEQ